MNHQEAKDLLQRKLEPETLSLIKVEVFRLSWEGKGYNIIAEETGYDHDYVRKAGSQLWKELSDALECSVTKRNFRPLLEEFLTRDDSQATRRLEYPGGAMLFSSPFYVERTREEAKAYSEIMHPGSVVRIKGPRKMGKSSLMLRVLDQADSEAYRTVVVDFLQADSSILSSLDSLLRWICLQISSQLSIEPALDDYWNELTGSKLSCSNYLQDHILQSLDQPLLLVVNELNAIFDHDDVSRDFLPLLRSWHEESKHNAVMQRLRQVLIYSTEVYVQLDINLSPFNVGLPIELAPFDGDQISGLASVYGFNWKNDGNASSPVTHLQSQLGGHPYLVQLAMYELANRSGLIESPSRALRELLAEASEPGGIYSDFLQQLLVDMSSNENAARAFKKIMADADASLSRIEMYQLERMGLIRIQNAKPVISSRLLADYLDKNLS